MLVDEALIRNIVDQAISRYCATRRAKVEQFAKDNFSFFGSLRLHRHAVGLDVLRAPINLALTVPFLTTQILSKIARMLDRGQSADWLKNQRFFLKTDVARELEWRLFVELLELPYCQGHRVSERDALAQELLCDARVKGPILEQLNVAGASCNDKDFQAWLSGAVSTYQGTRVSASDMSNTLLGAGIGALAFKQLTPGMMSLGPVAAHVLVQIVAIASFPLGACIVGIWYGLFPAVAPAAVTFGATVGLVVGGAAFAAFSGVLSDPIQRRFGIHQRRLNKLLNALEAQLRGKGEAHFTVRDHYVARIFDLFEGLNVIRTVL